MGIDADNGDFFARLQDEFQDFRQMVRTAPWPTLTLPLTLTLTLTPFLLVLLCGARHGPHAAISKGGFAAAPWMQG